MIKRLVFSLLFFGIGYSLSYSATLLQLRTEVRRNMSDTDSGDPRYSDAHINDYLNEAQRVIVNELWLADKTSSYVLQARTTYYALPDDFLASKYVLFNNNSNNVVYLEQKDQQTVYRENPQWESYNAAPTSYFISHATLPITSSTQSLRISYVPVPNNLSTGSVTIWYLNQPSDMIADNDIPFDGRRYLYPYHSALTYYATIKLKLIDGISDEVSAYTALYQSILERMRDRVWNTVDYNTDPKSKYTMTK